MSRSRNRLVADWFSRLRVNAITNEVEQIDVVDSIAATEALTTTTVNDAVNATNNAVGSVLTAANLKTINGASVIGSGDIAITSKVLGMAYTKYKGRQSSAGHLTGMDVSYVKKSSTSRLVVQSFLFGESNGHNNTLRIWNSVDGYFSDGAYGESDCSVKLDQGEYYSSDINSTPGTASHLAVTSKIAAGTNVSFRWYVTSGTTMLGTAWNSSYESASCWIMVTEVEE